MKLIQAIRPSTSNGFPNTTVGEMRIKEMPCINLPNFKDLIMNWPL